MIQRDLMILTYLEKFRVLSRDQIGQLVCSDTANPGKTASRICNRLGRDGFLTVIPQVKDKPYLYMPKPPLIHPHSTHTNHFLTIADLYIQLNKPAHFDVEPQISKDYQPDIYLTYQGIPTIVEVQLTRIAKKRMQAKVDEFVHSYHRKEHMARTLWIYSDCPYQVLISSQFEIIYGLDMETAMV